MIFLFLPVTFCRIFFTKTTQHSTTINKVEANVAPKTAPTIVTDSVVVFWSIISKTKFKKNQSFASQVMNVSLLDRM